jgi:hypothetical protein
MLTLYNYSSFKYCTQILTSSNSCMYKCYKLCDMDKYMKPVGCITKPVTHLILLNSDRNASWRSLFVVHFPFAFRWRFFFAWIARTVKWKEQNVKLHFRGYSVAVNSRGLNCILPTSPIHIISFNSVHIYYKPKIFYFTYCTATTTISTSQHSQPSC